MKEYVSIAIEIEHKVYYCVARFNHNKNEYTPILKPKYLTQIEADLVADELNEEYQKECEELKKKDKEESAYNE